MSDPENQTEEEQLEKALQETPTATAGNDSAEPDPDKKEESAPDPDAKPEADKPGELPVGPADAPPNPPDQTPEERAAEDAEKQAQADKTTAAAPATRKPRTPAQKEKRIADRARRKKAIADAPKAPDPSEEDEAEQKRKDEIRTEMAEIQAEIDDVEAVADHLKDMLREQSAKLYPHLVQSDHHVDAVRAYIASQKRVRATRASNPARIKAILEAAGRAPIDQAFQVQRARGAKRPQRPQAAMKPTGGDAAPGADKPKAKTGSE